MTTKDGSLSLIAIEAGLVIKIKFKVNTILNIVLFIVLVTRNFFGGEGLKY